MQCSGKRSNLTNKCDVIFKIVKRQEKYVLGRVPYVQIFVVRIFCECPVGEDFLDFIFAKAYFT